MKRRLPRFRRFGALLAALIRVSVTCGAAQAQAYAAAIHEPGRRPLAVLPPFGGPCTD